MVSPRQRKAIWIGCRLLLAAAVLGLAAAPAQAQGHFGLSANLYKPEGGEQDATFTFDVRTGYRIRPNFGFEWNLSHVQLDDTVPFQDDPSIPGTDFDSISLRVDLYNLDLSFQWFPKDSKLVVFAGPGVALVDSEIDFTFLGGRGTDPDNTILLTLNAGATYTWPIGKRTFLRPEIRVRHYFGSAVDERDRVEGFYYSYEATDYQAGVTFGWKFGS
jgi:hypothetical protein